MRRTLRIAVAMQDSVNANYRALMPLVELAKRGHAVCWPGEPRMKALRDGGPPSDFDVLYVQRLYAEQAVELMARVRRAGVAVVWDADDDIAAITRGTEAWVRLGGRRNVKRHAQGAIDAARTAHVVTTTSDHLSQVYREYGAEHVVTIENYLAPKELRHPRRRHQGIVIGITAAEEHQPDLKRMRFGAMLDRLLERHDGVRVVAIGSRLEVRSHRFTHLRAVPFEELIPTESEFDIGLAPLRDTAFNRARSNVKLKEYAAAGAMWLASPVGPYVGMGEEQGGLLVGDDQWLGALEALVADPDRRRALAQRAGAWVRGQTITAGAEHWQTAYREAVERARNGG